MIRIGQIPSSAYFDNNSHTIEMSIQEITEGVVRIATAVLSGWSALKLPGQDNE
jgi:hypothetical protein